MKRVLRVALTISISLIAVTAFALSTRAQPQAHEGVIGDLLEDLGDVETNVLDLATSELRVPPLRLVALANSTRPSRRDAA
jgi:hypothetical protein